MRWLLLLLRDTWSESELVVLLGVEHHLLVSPLGELSIRVVHLRLRGRLGSEVGRTWRERVLMLAVVHLGRRRGMVREVLRVLGVLEVLGVELHLREVARLAHLHMPRRRLGHVSVPVPKRRRL